jgi:hypothetical protein
MFSKCSSSPRFQVELELTMYVPCNFSRFFDDETEYQGSHRRNTGRPAVVGALKSGTRLLPHFEIAVCSTASHNFDSAIPAAPATNAIPVLRITSRVSREQRCITFASRAHGVRVLDAIVLGADMRISRAPHTDKVSDGRSPVKSDEPEQPAARDGRSILEIVTQHREPQPERRDEARCKKWRNFREYVRSYWREKESARNRVCVLPDQ